MATNRMQLINHCTNVLKRHGSWKISDNTQKTFDSLCSHYISYKNQIKLLKFEVASLKASALHNMEAEKALFDLSEIKRHNRQLHNNIEQMKRGKHARHMTDAEYAEWLSWKKR